MPPKSLTKLSTPLAAWKHQHPALQQPQPDPLTAPPEDGAQVGHSMGGAVAALFAMMLRCSIPDVRCFAYGPPACACAALSKAGESYIHSMVYCDDVVPRVSVQNVAALVEELAQCDAWQSAVGGDVRALLHRCVVCERESRERQREKEREREREGGSETDRQTDRERERKREWDRLSPTSAQADKEPGCAGTLSSWGLHACAVDRASWLPWTRSQWRWRRRRRRRVAQAAGVRPSPV
jgi:hypothetical protein